MKLRGGIFIKCKAKKTRATHKTTTYHLLWSLIKSKKLSFLNPNIFGFFAFKILSASFFMLSFINSIFCFWNHKNTHKKALAEID